MLRAYGIFYGDQGITDDSMTRGQFRPLPRQGLVITVCSALLRGLTENAIYSGHFDEKCHFIWLNHANNGAYF